MLDLSKVMNQATREGWALVALDVAVDTSTPSGEAMANMLATFAVFERRLTGQRTDCAGRQAVVREQLFATSCSARRSRRAAGIVAPPLPREAAPRDRLGLRAGRSTNHAHLFRSGRRMSFSREVAAVEMEVEVSSHLAAGGNDVLRRCCEAGWVVGELFAHQLPGRRRREAEGLSDVDA